MESGVKVSAVLTRGLDIHSCKFDDLGPGFPLDLLFLWAFMQTSKCTSKGSNQWFTKSNLWFQNLKKKLKTDNFCTICCTYFCSKNPSFIFKKPSSSKWFGKVFHSHPCPPSHPCAIWFPMEGWPAIRPGLSRHSCPVRSRGWSPSRRWWSDRCQRRGFST